MKSIDWKKLGSTCLQFVILFGIIQGAITLLKLLPDELHAPLYLGALALAALIGTYVTWGVAVDHFRPESTTSRIVATALFGPTMGTVFVVLFAFGVFGTASYALVVRPRRAALAIGLAISDAYHRHPVRPGILERLRFALLTDRPFRRLTPQEA